MKLSINIQDILSDEGYKPILVEKESFDVVVVRIDSNLVAIFFHKSDPNSVEIMCNIDDLHDVERGQILEWANEVNDSTRFVTVKVAKDNNVLISYASILFVDDNLKDVFLRYLWIVVNAYNRFMELRSQSNANSQE